MKRLFTFLLAAVAFTTSYAADYQLNLSYARGYIMNAETHQFQLEFVNMETYEGIGSILFIGKDNHHLNGEYTIDGTSNTANLAISSEEVFEAVSGTFTIEYSHEANFMSQYNISGTLTDKNGKTLELTGPFGTYDPYDYDIYTKYMMGEIGYSELVSYELYDKNEKVVNYSLTGVSSVGGYSMYSYYKKQGYDVPNWRLTIIGDNGKQVGSMVLYPEDDTHIVGTYDCSRNAFSYFDGSTEVPATSGLFSITFDHKTDSISYYNMKGQLQHKQGNIDIDCVLPIGLLPDYQSMADNYSDPESPILYVELKDYDTSGIEKILKMEGDSRKSTAYSLSGQAVNDSYKGIVIKNGKKHLRK